jgi:hypothetical protein
MRQSASEAIGNEHERRRRASVWLRIVAGLALVASLVINFGIIDLVTGIAPGQEFESTRMLSAGWGVVFGVLLPISLIAQMRRRGGPVAALQQLVVVTASVALATFLTVRAHEWLLVLVMAAFSAVLVALHPARAQLLGVEHRPHGVLVALATIAAVPAAIYAEHMAANRRSGIPGDDTNTFEHWTVQSAVAICLVLLVALSALRTDGWRVPGASAATGALILAIVAILTDDGPGDFGTGWAIAALAWATVVGLVVGASSAESVPPTGVGDRLPQRRPLDDHEQRGGDPARP